MAKIGGTVTRIGSTMAWVDRTMGVLHFALLMIILVQPAMTEDSVNYGVMCAKRVNESSKSSDFCIIYNPQFQQLPPSHETAEFMNLVNLVGTEHEKLCIKPSGPVPSLNGSAVAVKRGNCTFSEKAANVQSLGGKAILIVSPEMHVPAANSSVDYNSTKIIVALMSVDNFENVKSIGSSLYVKFFSPKGSKFDVNLLFILLTAVFTVIVGAYWSGNLRYQIWLRKKGLGPGRGVYWQASEEESKQEVQYSPKLIFFIVVLMCAMILGLYFLYKYLIYVIIALFVLGAVISLYDCLNFFTLAVFPPFATCRIPPNQTFCFKRRPELREIIILCISLAVGIWWLIERHKSYAWILQDILGVAFCIRMMKSLRLPNLKICAILMICLFVYDIFFVFITPLLTRDGSSVMIDIATGRGSTSNEKIPIVLVFPKVSSDELSACYYPYSLLGFGDILIPGFLVSFCYGFDLQVGHKSVYFLTTVIGYTVGLALTFLALVVMMQGQPALLYLVPCTLIPVVILALSKKQMKQIWCGEPKTTDLPISSEAVSLSQSDSPVAMRRPIIADSDKADVDYSSAGEEDKMLGQK